MTDAPSKDALLDRISNAMPRGYFRISREEASDKNSPFVFRISSEFLSAQEMMTHAPCGYDDPSRSFVQLFEQAMKDQKILESSVNLTPKVIDNEVRFMVRPNDLTESFRNNGFSNDRRVEAINAINQAVAPYNKAINFRRQVRNTLDSCAQLDADLNQGETSGWTLKKPGNMSHDEFELVITEMAANVKPLGITIEIANNLGEKPSQAVLSGDILESPSKFNANQLKAAPWLPSESKASSAMFVATQRSGVESLLPTCLGLENATCKANPETGRFYLGAVLDN